MKQFLVLLFCSFVLICSNLYSADAGREANGKLSDDEVAEILGDEEITEKQMNVIEKFMQKNYYIGLTDFIGCGKSLDVYLYGKTHLPITVYRKREDGSFAKQMYRASFETIRPLTGITAGASMMCVVGKYRGVGPEFNEIENTNYTGISGGVNLGVGAHMGSLIGGKGKNYHDLKQKQFEIFFETFQIGLKMGIDLLNVQNFKIHEKINSKDEVEVNRAKDKMCKKECGKDRECYDECFTN